jgi:hypothetical protein
VSSEDINDRRQRVHCTLIKVCLGHIRFTLHRPSASAAVVASKEKHRSVDAAVTVADQLISTVVPDYIASHMPGTLHNTSF